MLNEGRISREAAYMEMVDVLAKRSTCDRGNVGAIITVDDHIIATGYNGPQMGENHCNDHDCDVTTGCKRAVHAEANALEGLGGFEVGATMYCSWSPCKECAKLMTEHGITKLYFRNRYRKDDGICWLWRHKVHCFQVMPNGTILNAFDK